MPPGSDLNNPSAGNHVGHRGSSASMVKTARHNSSPPDRIHGLAPNVGQRLYLVGSAIIDTDIVPAFDRRRAMAGPCGRAR